MSRNVETIDADPDDIIRVRVTTEDAIGTERVYEVSITDRMKLHGEYVLGGRRVDDGAPDDLAGGGVPSAVYDAAAERIQAGGYEVFGR